MIELLQEGMYLYHGSYCEVQRPQLKFCAQYKDFGRGFYVTTDQDQARRFARLTYERTALIDRERVSGDCGVVSVFRYHAGEALCTTIFQEADAKWLNCIVAHRRDGTFPGLVRQYEKDDIIGGKIANDNTNATITLYMAGAFGVVGSEEAERICIGLLQPERLKDQYCFRSESALQCLEFVESERKWK